MMLLLKIKKVNLAAAAVIACNRFDWPDVESAHLCSIHSFSVVFDDDDVVALCRVNWPN